MYDLFIISDHVLSYMHHKTVHTHCTYRDGSLCLRLSGRPVRSITHIQSRNWTVKTDLHKRKNDLQILNFITITTKVNTVIYPMIAKTANKLLYEGIRDVKYSPEIHRCLKLTLRKRSGFN